MNINPPACFDAFFIILFYACYREGDGIAFFCYHDKSVGCKTFYFAFQGAVFQRSFIVILIGYFDGRNRADVSSGKLSFIDYAYIITEYNAIFTFKPCL